MKTIITLCTFVACATLSAAEESPDDIARRVIIDPTPAFTTIRLAHQSSGLSNYQTEKAPEEVAFDKAATQADRIFQSYILGDSVSEEVRIAYAMRALASKLKHRRLALEGGVRDFLDLKIEEQWLRDFLALSARFNHLQQEAEQDGTGQPATRPESNSEGSDKPQPEAEGRSR